jgi:glycosyltransferase involved in cell wall biosynthesis
MKRVLLITYHFPPRPTVASLRPLGLARYLPEFGWEVVILTAALPGSPDPHFNVIETQYHDSLGFGKRLLKLDSQGPLIAQVKNKLKTRSERSPLDFILAAIGGIIAYPDPQKGWRRFALEAGGDILRRQNIKAMISSSPPETSHIIAKSLKEEFKIPWVADFRDLWTQNYYYLYGPLRKAIEKRLELNTISMADALVAVSQPAADDLRNLHKQKPVHSIPNGFDPAEVNTTPGNLTGKFTITYTGNLYPGKQSPEPLFAALRDLITEGSMDSGDIEVRFYGPEAGWIDKQAESYGLTGMVRQFGMVPREIALDKQRESQLLLLLKWNDPKQRGFYTAKIFEYMAARRPVLAVGGFPDVVDRLLNETKAGVSGQTGEDIKALLLRFYQEYKSTGTVSYSGDETETGKYSHREMARKFAAILDSLSHPHRPAIANHQ